MPGQPGELPKYGADGKPYWADGTPVTMQEQTVLLARANGASDADIAKLEEGFTPHDTVPDTTVKGDSNDLLGAMGYLPKLVTEGAPGAELNTGQAQDEELRLRRLLEGLQQQATTGGGAWEQSLKDATQKASASAQALGQTQQHRGGDYAGALGDIGNAQSSAQQRAVGQGNILREKTKQEAQDKISALTSGMGSTAAKQAEAQGAARRQVRGVNQELINQGEKTTLGTVSGAVQAVSGSDGGEVPGKPEVFGDDQQNDTVPAWLSPGEIVLPRSVTEAPDAPAKAAEFVAALNRKDGHAGNFADGGQADDGFHQVGLEELLKPSKEGNLGYQALRDKYTPTGPPTEKGGGLLSTSGYDYARDAQNQNAGLLEQRAAGQGPSVAPQMLQNTNDANIEAALQQQSAGKAGAGEWLSRSTAAQQGAAGQAAGVTAQEQAAGQEGAAKALLDQQARDNAFAVAQQQAAWQNTLMNVGVGLDQQARMQQMFSTVGQGLSAASSLDFGDTGTSDNGGGGGKDESGGPYSFDTSSDTGGWGDFNTTDEGGAGGTDDSGDSGSAYAWRGGKVKAYSKGGKVDRRAEDFVQALSRGGYC